MEYKLGQIVTSRYGRDNGTVYMVVGFKDNYILLANGNKRKLTMPKQKNPKHLNATNSFLSIQEMDTDVKLKKALEDVYKNMSG